MPGGDGSGPLGNGSGGGRGPRRGFGGPAGKCVCPQCGHVLEHVRGKPCANIVCPKCGAMMTRQQQ